MEMGTGKSLSALKLAFLRQDKIDHVVWFCPVSVKETIHKEILKHTTCQDDQIYVFDTKTRADSLPNVAWYIVGIESLSNSDRITIALNGLLTEKTFVVVDESSLIKGHRARRTERITMLADRCKYRVILNGTPMSQGYADLYAQMRFLSPKILGYNSFYSFAANHLEYSEKHKGLVVRAHNTEHLASKIQPYVYQVRKSECIDLPPKLYKSAYSELTRNQWEHYGLAKDEILNKALEQYDEIGSVTIFRLFTALQQIVSGFWNRTLDDGSHKFIEFPHKRVETLLSQIANVPDSAKIIVWCKYRYSVSQVSSHLTRLYGQDKIQSYYGDLNEKQRANEIEKFVRRGKVLVATQQSGGRGLDEIKIANYVFFYENQFKFDDRLQAEDRSHRIGIFNPVTYTDIWSDANIDKRIGDSLSKKGNALESFKRQLHKVKDNKVELAKLLNEL